MPRKNNGKQRKGKFVRLNMEELSIISTFDAFFFFFLVNRCRQFMIKRPPIFILCSKREREKRSVRFARRMIQYARSLIVNSTRRMTETRKRCKRYAVRARIGSDQLTAKTAVAIHVMMDHGLPWFTGLRRLSFRLDRSLHSIARFPIDSRSIFIIFFFLII